MKVPTRDEWLAAYYFVMLLATGVAFTLRDWASRDDHIGLYFGVLFAFAVLALSARVAATNAKSKLDDLDPSSRKFREMLAIAREEIERMQGTAAGQAFPDSATASLPDAPASPGHSDTPGHGSRQRGRDGRTRFHITMPYREDWLAVYYVVMLIATWVAFVLRDWASRDDHFGPYFGALFALGFLALAARVAAARSKRAVDNIDWSSPRVRQILASVQEELERTRPQSQ